MFFLGRPKKLENVALTFDLNQLSVGVIPKN